jgi:hypothetical protein
MLLCKGRIEFTENTIFRREFSICSLTLSPCLYCNKHDTSPDGDGGGGGGGGVYAGTRNKI